MLGGFEVITNIAVKDMTESKKFYGETLGLSVVDENDYGITYRSGSGRLFVYQAPTAGTGQATCATWQLKDGINDVVAKLEERSIRFEHYEFPGVEYEGSVHVMGGTKSAWFRDPSGNILGLSQM